jgi:hypothetical protein
VIASEYAGYVRTGNTNVATGSTTGSYTISTTTQDNNNYVVMAGTFTPSASTVTSAGTSATGIVRGYYLYNTVILGAIEDNTSATPAAVVTSGTINYASTSTYALATMELRSR